MGLSDLHSVAVQGRSKSSKNKMPRIAPHECEPIDPQLTNTRLLVAEFDNRSL